VICGEHTGQFTYLGVRLSDAAMLRTAAATDSTRGFLAQKAGVLYAVSPSELKVTAGRTVIKQEAMIEYREVAR
jgi:nitrate reductase beta subunit